MNFQRIANLRALDYNGTANFMAFHIHPDHCMSLASMVRVAKEKFNKEITLASPTIKRAKQKIPRRI